MTSPKPSLKQRLKASFVEYPKVAIYTYLVLSVLTIAGFSIAIAIGAEPSSATGILGVIGAGWLAAKATMPIRILIVLAITHRSPRSSIVVASQSPTTMRTMTPRTMTPGSPDSAVAAEPAAPANTGAPP